jgi:aspartate/methionine/tyrosine aminotransferase
MAGWRMGMMAGSEAVLNEVVKFKTNMDSGMFLPLQQAAVAALALGNDWFQQNNAIYRERREVAWQIMDKLGCAYSKDAVGMFIWGRIPSPWKDAMELSDHCLYQNRVFLTPGNIFGSQGNGYIRLSLCSSVSVLQQALERL